MSAVNARDVVLRKANESLETQRQFFAEHAEPLGRCAEALTRVFEQGGRLYAIGNGGSACDAQHLCVEFSHPVVGKRRPLPAVALGNDTAFMTAVGNDEDFALAFARQVKLLVRQQDAVLGISTSGKSRNVLRALAAAKELGATTLGLCGKDGGRMSELCDHFFRVESFSIHRIQEAHTVFIHLLWDLVHLSLGEEDVI